MGLKLAACCQASPFSVARGAWAAWLLPRFEKAPESFVQSCCSASCAVGSASDVTDSRCGPLEGAMIFKTWKAPEEPTQSQHPVCATKVLEINRLRVTSVRAAPISQARLRSQRSVALAVTACSCGHARSWCNTSLRLLTSTGLAGPVHPSHKV